jgi:hypothetical protein
MRLISLRLSAVLAVASCHEVSQYRIQRNAVQQERTMRPILCDLSQTHITHFAQKNFHNFHCTSFIIPRASGDKSAQMEMAGYCGLGNMERNMCNCIISDYLLLILVESKSSKQPCFYLLLLIFIIVTFQFLYLSGSEYCPEPIWRIGSQLQRLNSWPTNLHDSQVDLEN